MAIRHFATVRTQRSSQHPKLQDILETEETIWSRVKAVSRLCARELYHFIRDLSTSFLGIHIAYITLWCIVLSVILYPYKNMSYTDALFMATSAITQTGLNTVTVGDLKLYQQICLFVTPLLTHSLMVDWMLVFYRLRLFERRFDDIDHTSKFQSRLRRAATMAQFGSRGRIPQSRPDPPEAAQFRLGDRHQKDERPQTESDSTSQSDGISGAQPPDHRDIRFGNLPRPPTSAAGGADDHKNHDGPNFNPQDMYRSLNMMQNQYHEADMDEDDGPPLVIKSPRDIEADEERGIPTSVFVTRRPSMSIPAKDINNGGTSGHMGGEGSEDGERLRRNNTVRSSYSLSSQRRSMTTNYLSWTPTIARNSMFVGLTEEQKEELGGVEYRALKALRFFIPAYWVVVMVVSFVMIVPWVLERHHYKDVVNSEGLNAGWFATSTIFSAFNNCGLSLMPNSIGSFYDSAYLPVILGFVIMAGNSALPIFFRVLIWIVFLFSPRYGRVRETLGFLLDHPRRCTMVFFPRSTTIWLICVFLVMMVVEITLFMILNSGIHSPYPNLSAGPRLLCAYFQSVSIRTAGLAIMSMGSQHPALLIWNLVMMYVAIYPLAMAIRKTNVYDEQTLGVYYAEDSEDGVERGDRRGDSAPSPLVMHIRRQLGVDLWGLVLSLLLLAITEGGPLTRGEFTLFDMIYELVSAYGTVGLSIGYKTTPLSLSGGFTTLGKLVMMGVMLRSRHRGLPLRVDRAILLRGRDVEDRDEIQQSRARDAQVYSQPDPSNDTPWMTRVGTTASRLRSAATLTRRSTRGRQSTDS